MIASPDDGRQIERVRWVRLRARLQELEWFTRLRRRPDAAGWPPSKPSLGALVVPSLEHPRATLRQRRGFGLGVLLRRLLQRR